MPNANPQPPSGPTAVVDIGSNTIKILVASRSPEGSAVPLFQATRETRVSRGLAANGRRLTPEAIEDGVKAVRSLLEEAAAHRPETVRIVATSALRDAENRDVFSRRIREVTGHDLRILTGDEEARAIARGVARDPALAEHTNFHLFDLGGGSMEALEVRNRTVVTALSLPLGAVTLTDRFVADPEAPFPDDERRAVASETARALRDAEFPLNPSGPVAATGGGLAIARKIFAARAGVEQEDHIPWLTVDQLTELLNEIASLPLARRTEIPGLPASRADIMPAALTVFLTLADLTGTDRILQSNHNLRFGLID